MINARIKKHLARLFPTSTESAWLFDLNEVAEPITYQRFRYLGIASSFSQEGEKLYRSISLFFSKGLKADDLSEYEIMAFFDTSGDLLWIDHAHSAYAGVMFQTEFTHFSAQAPNELETKASEIEHLLALTEGAEMIKLPLDHPLLNPVHAHRIHISQDDDLFWHH